MSMVHATSEIRGGTLVVTVTIRRLDAAAAVGLAAALREQVRTRPLVVVSLAHVEAMDASGVGALLSLLQAMPPGGRIRLASVRSSVRALLVATFLDELLPAFEDVPAALRA